MRMGIEANIDFGDFGEVGYDCAALRLGSYGKVLVG